jgi:hypothetical protein
VNTEIIDISCLCMVCKTPITKMVLSTRLKEVLWDTIELHNLATCYDCHLTRLSKKVGK